MKKIVTLILCASCLAPAFSQNLAGLDRWIINFPKGKTDFQGYPITNCVAEATGALLVIDRAGTAVRLNLIKPVSLDKLGEKYALVEKTVLNPGELAADKWNIAVKECEIDFGLKDEMSVTLRLASFRFRLNAETILELRGRLEADPVFRAPAQGGTFTYSLRFKAIEPGTGNRDAFPGWTAYVNKMAQWFQKGLNENDQETMAIVLETKVMKFEDRQAQKRIVLSKDERSNLWLGLNINYLMSNILAGEPFGIYANPGSYHLLQPMLYLDWRNLGEESWLAKPYRISVALGGFFEFNAGYFANESAGEYVGYTNGNGSFMIACGPSAAVEFTAMIPRIVDNRYAGDLFGAGLELLVAFNLPYFFPEYAYEYFLNAFLNVVIHVLPVNGIGLDGVAGFNIAFATMNYDEAAGGIYVAKYGFSIGLRLKLDFVTFHRSGEAPE